MGKHGCGKDSGKSQTDGSKPQDGKRGSGDKTQGNPSDGKKQGKGK